MKQIGAVLLLGATLSMSRADPLTLTQTIPLPNVEGRIDHFGFDDAAGRLFVAALGNNTVEVVDVKAARVVQTIRGLTEPQGIFFVREVNRLYVANGGDGSVRAFDGTTLAPAGEFKFDDDADNLRYDAAEKQLWVGYGSGGLGIIDVAKNVIVGQITLSAHPESFQLEPGSSRIFVNVPRSHEVSVVDRRSRRAVGKWSLGMTAGNFPMTLDAANHRAFIACRTPARLLVYDSASGKELAKLTLHGDCDDAFFDAKRHRIYASCGEGYVDVFNQSDPDHYFPENSVKTASRARTSFFDGHHLLVAAPRSGDEDARLLVYALAER